VESIIASGTINELIADARRDGHAVTVRLIRDWTEAGLLDSPQRRPRGKGHGSLPALYPAKQRMLLLSLLHHRPDNGIASLARIPVGIWMYWGDGYVPLRQARRAFMTWLGDPRVSQQKAKDSARALLGQLDNPAASTAARRELLRVVADVAYTGRADFDVLEHAVRDVFEPESIRVKRALGHPAAPITADSVIDLIRARLAAVDQLNAGMVTDESFVQARQAHLMVFHEYLGQQPVLAASAPQNLPSIYERPNWEATLNSCCSDLLTVLGLEILYPENGRRIRRAPE
jgi:hypothetical protein